VHFGFHIIDLPRLSLLLPYFSIFWFPLISPNFLFWRILEAQLSPAIFLRNDSRRIRESPNISLNRERHASPGALDNIPKK
jgi:hypothetical protein